MVLSTGVPSLADKRYFLSQMSSEASWKGIASTSLCSILTTLFMDGYRSPEVLGLFFDHARTGEKKKTANLETSRSEPSVCGASAVRHPPFLPSPQNIQCNHDQDIATQHLVFWRAD